MHGVGAELAHHRRHDLLGTPAPHHQGAVGGGAQRGQRAQQPGGARGAGPPEQARVEHEQGQDASAAGLLGRRLQGGVVVEAQVAAQPQHGVGHPATLAPTGRRRHLQEHAGRRGR